MKMNQFREGVSYIVGKIYNFQNSENLSPTLKKIEVIEVTRLTILYKDLDNPLDTGTRALLKDFNDMWKVVEILQRPTLTTNIVSENDTPRILN